MSFDTPFRWDHFALDLELYLAGVTRLRPFVRTCRHSHRHGHSLEVRFVGARDVIRADFGAEARAHGFIDALHAKVAEIQDAHDAIRDLVDQ